MLFRKSEGELVCIEINRNGRTLLLRKAEQEFFIVEKEPKRKDVLDRKLRGEETI